MCGLPAQATYLYRHMWHVTRHEPGEHANACAVGMQVCHAWPARKCYVTDVNMTPTNHVRAVYDVTRRETFSSLEEVWLQEFEIYSTVEDAIKMVVANKVDLVRRWMGPWVGQAQGSSCIAV